MDDLRGVFELVISASLRLWSVIVVVALDVWGHALRIVNIGKIRVVAHLPCWLTGDLHRPVALLASCSQFSHAVDGY